MFKLDDNFLIELGLGSLPAGEKNKMLSHIYETLEMKVGMRLAEKMSNDQLDEFETFINRNDEAGALKWLESNFPNYKEVVAEELEKLKGEIRQVAPQIITQAASTSPPAGAQPPAPMPPVNSPYPPYAAPQQPAYQPQDPGAPLPPPTQSQMPPAYPQPQYGQASMSPHQDFGMPPQAATPPSMPAYDPAPIQQQPQHMPYQPPAHHQQQQPPSQFGVPAQQPGPSGPGFGGAPSPFQHSQNTDQNSGQNLTQPFQPAQSPQPDPFAASTPAQNMPSPASSYHSSPSPSNNPGSTFQAFDQQAPPSSAQPTTGPTPAINFAQPNPQNADAAYGATQPSNGFGMNNQFAGASPAGMHQAQDPQEPYQPPR